VFIDSPLGLEITRIYARLAEFWDEEARALLAKGDHPIDFERLYGVEKHVDHEKLLNLKDPAVIIAGSGMCTGGRIVNHLTEGIGMTKNDILFVGYQAAGTPGRAIQGHVGGNGTVVLDGKECTIRAGVHTISGYSAHADQAGLLDWVGRMPEKPGQIKLVHGEPKAQKVLAEKLEEEGYCVEGLQS
jgi:metallo-beta-lactamase family protein